jgi:mannobiose 2-epimerase
MDGQRVSRAEISYGGSGQMKEKEIAGELLGGIRKELGEDIVPFWLKYGVDSQHGGFIGRMSNDLTVQRDAPKGLVLNARILWTFAALYRFDRKPEYLQMARRAYEYLMQNFWDKEHGGAFWMLDYQGKPIDDSKELYGESFLVYALSEYFQATGDTQALEKAKELFALIEKYCHDNANSGYYETFSRNWSPAEAARLATGSKTEKKTMNTHLHLLEAYTSLYRSWQDEKLKQRLEELIRMFVDYIVDPKTYHFRLFFDEKWQPTGSVASFGHDIEGSWLLCEAADVLGDKQTISQMQQLAVKMAQAVYQDGLDTDGGLFYEGQDNKIINAEKHWWPQAEAVVGFLNAYQISKQPHFLLAAQQCWGFIENHIVDHQFGEWFWMAPKAGQPDPTAVKVSEWKCPYHNSRACLEAIRRLQAITAGGSH